ncbi:hypothetical protein PG993_003785 [Apiospora rasikravindrae]|uniref:Uncharacterized protein n=1 Tax=Apiospora rasikravindrae TaxID=990691 RepID=A0ABR1U2U4_9PEZI
MTTGTAVPPSQFTPAPTCRDSLLNLYMVTGFAQESPTGAHQPACTTASGDDLWTCAYYNLGYQSQNGGEGCVPSTREPRVNEAPKSYAGCPVGYTTACAGTNAQRDKEPYWPSTIVEAVCCPTHSAYSFTCDNPQETSTATDFAWDDYIYGTIGCVAAVPPPMTAVDVLQVERVTIGTWLSYWTETNRLSTFTANEYQYDYDASTSTSTATLTPGIDRVSAQAVHNHYTAWGRSTCYGRHNCQTPAPMWEAGYHKRPADPPWPVAGARAGGGATATGVASVVLLLLISIAFSFSVIGFLRKGKQMHERRERIRRETFAETRRQEAEARRRDLLYTDQSPETGST